MSSVVGKSFEEMNISEMEEVFGSTQAAKPENVLETIASLFTLLSILAC